MDILSFSILRRKIFECNIHLDPKIQEAEKHYNNTAIKHTSQYSYNIIQDHPFPSILVSEAIEMKIKLTVIIQEVSNGNT